MSAVFDANVVVKWFIDDPLADAALQARIDWPAPTAPALMPFEVANAFRRYVVRKDLSLAQARENLGLVPQLVRLLDARPFLDDAMVMACGRNHSIQDCIYAAMALRQGVPLVTADGKLARKLADVPGLDIHLIAPSSVNE